jgi:Macro domain
MLTVAPVDFPIEVNSKISKIIEYYSHCFFKTIFDKLRYEYNTAQITNWTDIKKFNDNWNIGIWKGDITTLKIDTIVNAANKYLLGNLLKVNSSLLSFLSISGCFQPGHKCIDNVIHCRAGPLLREECRRLVAKIGKKEATGKARLTLGYLD